MTSKDGQDPSEARFKSVASVPVGPAKEYFPELVDGDGPIAREK